MLKVQYIKLRFGYREQVALRRALEQRLRIEGSAQESRAGRGDWGQ
jgi:hypothetical protein